MATTKKCPECKGSTLCGTCKGSGTVRVIQSRPKGCRHERMVAKTMSEWSGFTICRTPASGAILKSGDLMPKTPEDMVSFPFSVECKNRQGWDFRELLTRSTKNGIFDYWSQCHQDALKARKVPLLIFTRIGDPNYCMMRDSDFKYLVGPSLVGMSIHTLDGFMVFLLSDLVKVDYSLVSDKFRERKGA